MGAGFGPGHGGVGTMEELRALMGRYTVENLDPFEASDGMEAKRFQERIESLPGTVYGDDPNQRPFDNVFTWGHDHDFGTFQMKGQMGDRHIRVVKAFLDMGVEFKGRVLDVGCWTGGTSLLLAAMGCEVTAVEEALHYAGVMNFLAQAFGLGSQLEVIHWSLYDLPGFCEPVDMVGRFDLVLCAGVLYHVTDPVRALRIMFERLADGGTLLLETAISEVTGKHLVYCGPQEPGYRWLLPTVEVLYCMLVDVGFKDIQHELHADGSRATVVAKRKEHVSMMMAGVSR